MKYALFLSCLIIALASSAQDSTGWRMADSGSVVVHRDPRLDLLVKKQIQYNDEITRDARKNQKGFRILVINTNKRDEALAAKSKVYSHFPELKSYLVYQSPYFKLKVGNFKERKDAEDYQKKLQAYFPSGVFIMNDVVEVKLSKSSDEDNNNR
jgi:Skp family chaperone for outer membrane proteins